MSAFGKNPDKEIDFRPKWKVSLIVSVFLVVVSLLSLGFRGLNLSIDLEGGALWEVPAADTTITIDELKESLSDIAVVKVQEVSNVSGDRESFRIEADVEFLDKSDEIRTKIAEVLSVPNDSINGSETGPKWGEQIKNKSIEALVVFFILVALYLAWTLEWGMSLGALVAVFHDLVITAGFYSIIGFEVSPATVIALLTILGYSIYDTVVVYDKVKENESNPLLPSNDYTALVNTSMNQVLMRSLNTSITTVVPVLSMLVIGGFFLKASSLVGFALALFIGLLCGVYSSIFVAAPMISWLRNLQPEARQEAKVEAKREAKKVSIQDDDTASRPLTEGGTIKAKARKKGRTR